MYIKIKVKRKKYKIQWIKLDIIKLCKYWSNKKKGKRRKNDKIKQVDLDIKTFGGKYGVNKKKKRRNENLTGEI